MRDQKLELIAVLVRYINNLEKGSKTVVFMTALLLSWEEMEVAQVESIIDKTRVACAIYASLEDYEKEMN